MFSDNKTLNDTLCLKSNSRSDIYEYLRENIYKIADKFSGMAVTESLIDIVAMKIKMFLDEEKNDGTIYGYNCHTNPFEHKIGVMIRLSASLFFKEIIVEMS